MQEQKPLGITVQVGLSRLLIRNTLAYSTTLTHGAFYSHTGMVGGGGYASMMAPGWQSMGYPPQQHGPYSTGVPPMMMYYGNPNQYTMYSRAAGGAASTNTVSGSGYYVRNVISW